MPSDPDPQAASGNLSSQRFPGRLLLPIACLVLGFVGGFVGALLGSDSGTSSAVPTGSIDVLKGAATTAPSPTTLRPPVTVPFTTVVPRPVFTTTTVAVVQGPPGPPGPAGKDGRGINGIQWIRVGGNFNNLMEWYATCPTGTLPMGWQLVSASNAILVSAGEFDSTQKWWFRVASESTFSSSGSAYFKLGCLLIS